MTPIRDLLLDRHRAAEPKLDGVRRRVLETQFGSEQAHRKAALPSRTGWWPEPLALCWQHLIRPWRRAWLALATAWVGIAALQLMTADRSSPTRASVGPPSPDESALLQQQRLLRAELLGIRPLEPAKPAQPAPLPSSQNRPGCSQGLGGYPCLIRCGVLLRACWTGATPTGAGLTRRA